MEETLGKRIAKHRKRLGLTQDRLAELLGVTAQAVSKWENDQSCPDISTLPKLAEIFSITTDELLGTARTVEATVEDQAPGAKSQGLDVTIDTGKHSMIGFAIWLLLAGSVAFLYNRMNIRASTWTILWSSGLLSFGLMGLWPRFSVFRLGCAAAGGYFLLEPWLGLPGLDWSVILIILGVLLLLQALQKKSKHTFHCNPHVKVTGKTSDCRTDGEHFSCSSTFGERHNRISLGRMSSGYAENHFGELTVDLSGCGEIADGARVEIDNSFGELHLLVPGSCRVVSNVHAAFGNCTVYGQPDPDASVTIYVDGSVSFGEGNIRYI